MKGRWGMGGRGRSSSSPDLALLKVESTAFEERRPIPVAYTEDGADLSPPLSWSPVPPATGSVALLLEDLDVPGEEPFVHWVLFNLPVRSEGRDFRALPAGLPPGPHLRAFPSACQGTNDFGCLGYRGPAPPRGSPPHHYRFRVFALDRLLDLEPGALRTDLLAGVKDRLLGAGELIGTYRR